MKRMLAMTLALGIFVSACSMPAAAPQQNSEISTAAALTVQAVLNTAPPPAASPTLAPTPTMPQITSTPTSAGAMINVSEVTNCRAGPGKNYDRVAQIMPNEPVKIAGFFPSNYWIVTSANGDCWLSAEFATPSGDFGAVPRVTAPPTPLGGIPDPPSFSKNGWTWFCYGSGQTDIELNWNDNANNETGYRIYRNDELVIELPADSTHFKETVPYPGSKGLTYKVEAFNEVGSSSGSTSALFCQ